MYAAMDMNGEVWLYEIEPERREETFVCPNYWAHAFPLDKRAVKGLEGLTWDNSPREVELTIRIK